MQEEKNIYLQEAQLGHIAHLSNLGPYIKILKWPHPIFVITSPLKRTWPLICMKIDWNWLAYSGEEDFFLLISVFFFTFLLLSQLGERGTHFIWTNLDPQSPEEWFMSNLVEIGSVVPEKRLKMWKVNKWLERHTTDNGQSEKLTWAFSSGELKMCFALQSFQRNTKSYSLRRSSAQ
jgi:hypothetical protein